MAVEIYGREGCGQCTQAKVKFHRAGVEYEYLMLDDHREALDAKFETLPRSLPIIVNGDKLYNFTQVDGLIKEIKG